MHRIIILSIPVIFMAAAPIQLFAARSIAEYTKAIEQSPEERIEKS